VGGSEPLVELLTPVPDEGVAVCEPVELEFVTGPTGDVPAVDSHGSEVPYEGGPRVVAGPIVPLKVVLLLVVCGETGEVPLESGEVGARLVVFKTLVG